MKNINILSISEWFKEVKPEPTIDDVLVQIGCHIEEFGEMLEALGYCPKAVLKWADDFKQCKPPIKHKIENLKNNPELLDSLADQVVTAIGVANYLDMDINGALSEVNQSNYSKFENNKPIFDSNGKVKKGSNYFKPRLEKFLGLNNDQEKEKEIQPEEE